MIKGINRQVVEVKDTGNECFERILFFVRPESVWVYGLGIPLYYGVKKTATRRF